VGEDRWRCDGCTRQSEEQKKRASCFGFVLHVVSMMRLRREGGLAGSFVGSDRLETGAAK
jgi:hypothetical protein